MNNPEEYIGSSQLQYRVTAEIIREFSEELKKMDGRIIDIGCGPGIVTRDLLLPNVGKNAVIVGADISADMLEYAKKHHENEERMSFIHLDIGASNLPENLIGQFDHAVSFFCLNWTKNMKVTTKNIYNLLRPDGKAVVLLVSSHAVFDFYLKQKEDPKFSLYMQDALKYICPHHGHQNPEEMLRGELEGAGFKVLHCTNRRRIHSFQTVELQLDMLMSVNPFLHRMPEEIRKQCKEDMEARIRNNQLRTRRDKDPDDCTVDDHYTVLVAVFEKPLN